MDPYPDYWGNDWYQTDDVYVDYYGDGYQDVTHRRPSIRNANQVLGWQPVITLEESVDRTLDFFLRDHLAANGVDVGTSDPPTKSRRTAKTDA